MRRFFFWLCFCPALTFAQSWPTHPITILMGFPAGSGVDVVARLLQEPMEKSLGGRIVTDYRTGAGGNLASEAVARAKPDGYTLLLGTAATHGVNAALYKTLPFDVEADFTPISPLVNVSNVLTINPQVIDVKTVREFIDVVRANPGKYNYASTGNGTGTHLAFAEFNARAGLRMEHIPYKGGPEAIQSVIGGQTCCIFNQVQTVIPHWRANRVRLLGVSTKTRVQAVSEVPTIAEAGVPGYESYTWFGLFGPKGLDPEIVTRVNAAVKAALDTPLVQRRLLELGNSPRWESPEQFRETVKADRQKWAALVKEVGATID
jgi:tripartite-type tricarboxylate transporter receptor subunit TctC